MQNKPDGNWEAGCHELFDHMNAWDILKLGMNSQEKGVAVSSAPQNLPKKFPGMFGGFLVCCRPNIAACSTQGRGPMSLFALFSSNAGS